MAKKCKLTVNYKKNQTKWIFLMQNNRIVSEVVVFNGRVTIFMLLISLIFIGTSFKSHSKVTGDVLNMRTPHWQVYQLPVNSSFRSVYMPGQNVIWAGGTHNTWVRSVNNGKVFQTGQVPADGAELDFRGVMALDGDIAWLMSAGESAKGQTRIYKTVNGGKDWVLEYQPVQPGIFLDGIRFWDASNGIAFGDPVLGHFFILLTHDGGRHWVPLALSSGPAANPGEGAFAASGSSLVTRPGGYAWIGTGGTNGGRVFNTRNYGKSWTTASTSLQSDTSSGIFGLLFLNENLGFAVGGDYRKIHQVQVNAANTGDGGKTWQNSRQNPDGLEEGIAWIQARNQLIAVGPSGTVISADSGRHWSRTDTVAFHTIGFSQNSCWAAGQGGKIAELVFR